MTSPFRIQPISQVPNWDEFVTAHPGGTIFYTRAMVSAMQATPLYEPLAIAAVKPDGEIVAMLVAVKISMPKLLPEKMSARSIFFSEPICVDDPIGLEAHRCLLAEHDRLMQDKVVFAEIRPMLDSRHSKGQCKKTHYTDLGYQHLAYKNYELDLRQNPAAIFAKMSRSRRTNIRSNQRHGLTVREANPIADLGIFYGHLMQSFSKSRVPLVDAKLFVELFKTLQPDQYRLTIAELNGKPVASTCHLIFKDRVYWWQAGMERTPGICPQGSLVWETIQWASARGQRIYDFAGAGWENEIYGPGIFKARFGGEHIQTRRYRKVYSKLRMKIAEVGYQTGANLFRYTKYESKGKA